MKNLSLYMSVYPSGKKFCFNCKTLISVDHRLRLFPGCHALAYIVIREIQFTKVG